MHQQTPQSLLSSQNYICTQKFSPNLLICLLKRYEQERILKTGIFNSLLKATPNTFFKDFSFELRRG